jgi:hypothetical protein
MHDGHWTIRSPLQMRNVKASFKTIETAQQELLRLNESYLTDAMYQIQNKPEFRPWPSMDAELEVEFKKRGQTWPPLEPGDGKENQENRPKRLRQQDP